MSEAETLTAVAELALGLAGFSAIVIALGERSGRISVDRLAVIFLLTASFVTLFLALIPLVLVALGLGESSSFRVSSAAMVIVAIVWLVALVPAGFRENVLEPMKESVFTPIALGLAVANIVLQGVSAAGLIGADPFGIYPLGLFVYLLGAASTFFRILLFVTRRQ
jgi:hypothetical protein